MNRFAYAEANPWTFSDPSGHATCYSSSDLCDETIAIKHQGTQAARDAARRISSRYKVNYWWNLALRAGLSTRAYESTPQSTPETVPADQGWGENASIARASAAGASAQSAGVRCAPSRFGTNCQNAQQQADSAATSAGIGDAFGDIWNSALHLGSCVGNVLNCADVGLGLTMMALNPIGAGQAIADQRLAAIQSGDKRAGAHAITSTVIDVASLVPALGALKGVTVADAAQVTEGIYQFPDATADGLPYVGNSGNIALRLFQHLAAGKLKLTDLGSVRRWSVPGGRTAREIAEQLRINDLGGIQNLGNKINVIGPDFQDLMQTFSGLDEYLDYLRYHIQ